MHLLTLWPWLLTFQSQNHIISRISQDYSLRFEHFGIIRLWVMLRRNWQTDKQTDANIISTPTDRVMILCVELNSAHSLDHYKWLQIQRESPIRCANDRHDFCMSSTLRARRVNAALSQSQHAETNRVTALIRWSSVTGAIWDCR